MWWRSVIWAGAIFGALAAMLPQVLWLLLRIAGRAAQWRVPYMPFAVGSLVLMAAVWGLFAYGYYVGRFRVEVSCKEYESAMLPRSFDGFRVAHISDLHVDSFRGHSDALRRVVEEINRQHADVVVFTGDVNTGTFDEVPEYAGILSQIQAACGVYSVLGNHDFFIYCKPGKVSRGAMTAQLERFETEVLGWHLLRNGSVLLRRGADSIAIAGVDNTSGKDGFHTINRGDLPQALSGLEGVFTILLTHDPGHWDSEVLPKTDVPLTLSGHTHAAQARLFGWSPARLMFRHCDGAYAEGGRMLNVSAGIGCTAPFRIGCPSDISVITLRSAR